MNGKIYLISTPIGNLGDFSFRAVEVLKTADLVAAEDTRRSQILLKHYGISKKMVSLREHNEAAQAEKLVALAAKGKVIAYLSDAGTPLVSDPGLILVKKALAAGVAVNAIPGPAAFLQALVLSGLPTAEFKFLGFLPPKKSERSKALHDVEDETTTLIFYEAPHRILESLADILEILGDRQIAVGRELTKKFEEVRRGSVAEILAHFQKNNPRGEFVLVVEGRLTRRDAQKTGIASGPGSDEKIIEKFIKKMLQLKISEKEIIALLKDIFQLPRNQAYQLILEVKKSSHG